MAGLRGIVHINDQRCVTVVGGPGVETVGEAGVTVPVFAASLIATDSTGFWYRGVRYTEGDIIAVGGTPRPDSTAMSAIPEECRPSATEVFIVNQDT